MGIAPEHVVTFERVDGFRVVRTLGTAYGRADRPRNVLRDAVRSIGAFIGLAPLDVLTDAERARAECLEELLRSAERLGANGIVGLRFSAVEGDDGRTRVTAYGEAVILEPRPDAAA